MRGSANASENFKKISKIVENCLEVGQILKKKKKFRGKEREIEKNLRTLKFLSPSKICNQKNLLLW